LSDENAVDLWTMRLRRNASLAVENPAGFPPREASPTASTAAAINVSKKLRNNPELSTRVGNFQCPQLGKSGCTLTS
jgi:hypothetical protein